MKRLRLAAVGDNCIDRFLPPVDQSLLGGNAVNVAVQLALIGHDSFYFGALGRDPDGEYARELMRTNGVNVDHVQMRSGPTAYTNIEVLPSGDRVFLKEEFGVCAGYRPSSADVEILKTMDHVHIGWLDDGGALRQALVAAGVSVSQDISVNAEPQNLGTEGLKFVFVSAGDDEAAAECAISAQLSAGVPTVVVTMGAKGAVAATRNQRVAVGIREVNVIDTTGAGDSFIAGFLATRLSGGTLQQSLDAGRDRAALTCGHVGGFPQKPF